MHKITTNNILAMFRSSGRNIETYKKNLRKALGISTKEYPIGGEFANSINVKEASLSPEQFSVQDAYQIGHGRDVVDALSNEKTAEATLRHVQEDLAGISPSSQQAVSLYNATIAGLAEAKILQMYQLPEFIGDNFFDDQPSRFIGGGKMLGEAGIKPSAGFTAPLQEYEETGFVPRTVVAPPAVKKGHKVSMSREAVIADLTGEFLQAAETVGRTLRYEKEYMQAASVMGVDIAAGTDGFQNGYVVNTYIYSGNVGDTPNATYQSSTSGKYNYLNKLTGAASSGVTVGANPLTDYTAFGNLRTQLSYLREYETNLPISVALKQMVIPPALWGATLNILRTMNINQGTSLNSNYPSRWAESPNPISDIMGGLPQLYTSNIWYKVLQDQGVTGRDTSWYAGDHKKAFVWRTIWPVEVRRANPLSPEMLDRDIVDAIYCSWMGCPVVRDPRFAVYSLAT